MTEAKHTPLTISGHFIDAIGRTPIFVGDDSLRHFIVLACNSHAKREAVINGLVDALRLIVGLLEHPGCHVTQSDLKKAHAALAAEKEKK